MLVRVNELFKYDIQATDGQIGQSYDVLCDDRFWTCRFMLVDTHPWLPLSHKVLLSPTSLNEMNLSDNILHVSLTKEKVKAAPSIDSHEPVSREFERSFFDFYGYGYYWLGPHPWGVHNDPFALADMQKVAQEIKDEDARKENKQNHLRSLKEIKKYGIVGVDHAKGHVQDLIIGMKANEHF